MIITLTVFPVTHSWALSNVFN